MMVHVQTSTVPGLRVNAVSVVDPIGTLLNGITHAVEQTPPIISTCVLIATWIAVMVATFTICRKSLAFVELLEIEAGGARD